MQMSRYAADSWLALPSTTATQRKHRRGDAAASAAAAVKTVARPACAPSAWSVHVSSNMTFTLSFKARGSKAARRILTFFFLFFFSQRVR